MLKLLLLALLAIGSTNSLQSNLTQFNDAVLSISAGLQLIHVRAYSQKIYGIAANGTHFQIVNCDWPNGFTIIDQSPVFPAFIDLSTQHSQNPRIYQWNSLLQVRYYDSLNSSAKIIQASLTDLTSYTITDRGQGYLGEYVSSIDSIYYRNQLGEEKLIRDFLGNESILYSYTPSYNVSSIDNILMKSSGSYMVTIDKLEARVAITKINTYYIWPTTYFGNASTTQYTLAGQIQSACFFSDKHIYLHSSDGCAYKIVLSGSVPICYNTSIFTSLECFYDSPTQSIMLVNDGFPATDKIIDQFGLTNNFTYNYTIPATNILYSGTHVIYFGSTDVLTGYSTQSCVDVYNQTFLICEESCPAQCLTCNYSYYCTSCAPGYFLGGNSTYYAVLKRPCSSCPTHCEVCDNIYTCQICFSPYILNTTSFQCEDPPTPTSTMQKMTNLLGNITSFVTNTIPSARSVLRPILFILISFDDFFPYMFHERDYGKSFNGFFNSIHEAETEKWSTYDKYFIDPIIKKVAVDKDAFTHSYDTYYNHSSYKFIEWEGNGETVLISAFSFFTTNIVFSVTLFITCRIIFNILFQYRISLLFRPYSFWPNLFFFIMEGNLQVVTFYTCSVIKLCFFYTPAQKFQTAIVFFGLYFLVLYSVGGYFLIFQKLGVLTKYFADNVNPSLKTIFFLTFQYGLKNLLMAIVHSIFRSPDMYRVQFTALAAIELLCLANYIIFLSEKRIFEVKLKVWMMFLLSLVRLSILMVLYIQQKNINNTGIASTIEDLISSLLIIYLFLMYIGIVIAIFFFFFETGKFVKNCVSHPKAKEKPKKEEPKGKTRFECQKEMIDTYFGQQLIEERKKKKEDEEKKKNLSQRKKNKDVAQQKNNVQPPKKMLDVRKVPKQHNHLIINENKVSIQEKKDKIM